MAVIKADGYGHGIIRVAKGLAEADGFAVACLEEAVRLREAGFKHNILLLEGVFEPSELKAVVDYELQMVVHCPEQVRLIETTAVSTPLAVWMKVDTGMHRLGFLPNEFTQYYQRLAQLKQVTSNFMLMTHLACADEVGHPANQEQLSLFHTLTTHLSNPKSVVNSAGLFSYTDAHHDWVRPGIMLYGINPFNNGVGSAVGLKPVMNLKSEIIAIKSYQAGAQIGYGGTYTCDRPTRVGVVAIGYGDGYPRHAPTGTPVAVAGQRSRLLGRVSMDMITIDVSEIDGVKVGSPVCLWGDALPIEEVAQSANTIGYELVCRLTPRVPRVVLGVN